MACTRLCHAAPRCTHCDRGEWEGRGKGRDREGEATPKMVSAMAWLGMGRSSSIFESDAAWTTRMDLALQADACKMKRNVCIVRLFAYLHTFSGEKLSSM